MQYFRPNTSPEIGATVKTSRLSIFQDTHSTQAVPLSGAAGNEKPHVAAKRMSKLPDIITVGLRRNRTTSLPQRPRSSDGRSTARTPANGEPGQDSVNSVASSSLASVAEAIDPFAAYPSSSSFVTYDNPRHQQLSRSRPNMHSPQRVVHSGPVSQVTVPPSGPSRRRGSILIAASDAINSISSSFAKKKRPVGLGAATPTPIVLSEVIEISSSSNARLREHEDEERERLREVAAQSLGLGPVLLEDKLSKLKSGEDFIVMDSERDRVGRMSRLGRMSSDDDEGDTGDDDEREIPPESDITGFSSVTVSVPTPMLPTTSPPIQPQPVSAFTQPFQGGSSAPATNPFTLQNRTRSGSIARSHHSHSHSQSIVHYHATHISRSNSTTPGPVQGLPPFPASHAMIKPFLQHQASFLKHYPPPSLIKFALVKQWKSRFLILTSPAAGSQGPSPRPSGSSYTTSSASHGTTSALRPSAGPAVSYLHLFKGTGLDEREIERLEINDDSVVCLSEEEVGGKRNIVKVGGVDVGAMKKELNSEEGGRTMWCLQISDQAEAQKWIGAIKSAVLSQRSVRAGLGTVSNTNGMEPRGDLDVVLSMRAQGLHPIVTATAGSNTSLTRVQSPSTPQQATFPSSPEHENTPDNRGLSPPPSISRSHSRGQAASPTPSTRHHNSAVSALRGLFTSTRPRSPSSISAASKASVSNGSADHSQGEPQEDSFGALGTNLLLMRSNSVSTESQFSPTSSSFSTSITSPTGMGSPLAPSTPRLPTSLLSDTTQPLSPSMIHRKIVPDSDRQHLAELAELSLGSSDSHASGHAPGRMSALAMKDSDSTLRAFGSPSLQPPPRRRAWTASETPHRNPPDSSAPQYPYSHANGSAAESLGVRHLNGSIAGANGGPSTPGADSLKVNGHGRKRTSWSSATSSFTSGSSTDYHGSSPDLVARRRSLQNRSGILSSLNGSPLPTPSPLGSSSSRPSTTGSRHPYAAEQLSSPTSSGPSSPQSLVLDLRPLSPKRASTSSMHSFTTASTSQSRSPGKFQRPSSSHRASMPPPQRPAPLIALPPTPNQTDEPVSPSSKLVQSAPVTKGAFREILSQRQHRLSLSPPSQPPLSALPPRPDEPTFKPSHRKSASTSSAGPSSPLCTIPASPVPPSAESPFSPPLGLPPATPTSPSPPASNSNRHSISFKHRLRILSAPGPSLSRTPTPPITTLQIDTSPPDDDHAVEPTPPVIPLSFSADPIIPPTPIGERILQNDADFLSLSSPSTPMMSTVTPRNLPLKPSDQPPPAGMLASLEDSFEGPSGITMTSLSPPPRRGSKRVSTPDKERLEAEVMKSPHNVPSFMDIRNGREENDAENAHSPVAPSLDLDLQPQPAFQHDDDDDDDDYDGQVKSDDDEIHHKSLNRHENGFHPLIQIHKGVDDQSGSDFSPHSPVSVLSADEATSTAFSLSPPARPHRLSEHGSVISLVDSTI
ncbi:hypothetical protein BXZ70DRAFT_1005315 [Cristinia sonorae]|uniref:PH domain-containing protein n=1 Tax=Cristinia sonorae TaxID=1940300 RepID=A0A8K0UUS1_9AGAR|nr:hypothetical protein BXZ70DRAFT_1005315 [Cristinia sonorae]